MGVYNTHTFPPSNTQLFILQNNMQSKIITLLLLVMVLSLSFCDMASAESLGDSLKAVVIGTRKKLEECPQCKGEPFGSKSLATCLKTCDDQKKSVSGGAATTQQSFKSNTKA